MPGGPVPFLSSHPRNSLAQTASADERAAWFIRPLDLIDALDNQSENPQDATEKTRQTAPGRASSSWRFRNGMRENSCFLKISPNGRVADRFRTPSDGMGLGGLEKNDETESCESRAHQNPKSKVAQDTVVSIIVRRVSGL